MTDDRGQMTDERRMMIYQTLGLRVLPCPRVNVPTCPLVSRSLMRDRLVEVEGEARDHGPGGEFGQVGAGGVRPLADP